MWREKQWKYLPVSCPRNSKTLLQPDGAYASPVSPMSSLDYDEEYGAFTERRACRSAAVSTAILRHMERPWIHVRTLNRSSDIPSTSSAVLLVVQLPPLFWDSWRNVRAQKKRGPVIHLAAYCENHAKHFFTNVMQVVHTVTTALLIVLPQLKLGT